MTHAYANIKVNGYNSWFMRYRTDRRADTTDRVTFPLEWLINANMFHSVITLIAKTSSPTAMISTPTYCLGVYSLGKTGTCLASRKLRRMVAFIIIPAEAFARDYVITGVGLNVCLSVCYHDN